MTANRAYAHDEPRSGGREDPAEVMRECDGVEVESAVVCVGGVAAYATSFAVFGRGADRCPGTSCTGLNMNTAKGKR